MNCNPLMVSIDKKNLLSRQQTDWLTRIITKFDVKLKNLELETSARLDALKV